MDREEVHAKELRLAERIEAAVDVAAPVSMTLAVWQWGILMQSATDTASSTVRALSSSEDGLTAFMAGARFGEMIEAVMTPLQDQNPEKFGPQADADEDLTVALPLMDLTRYLSLCVAPLVIFSIPKPTRPVPSNDSEELVSDGIMLWYAVIRYFSQFPEAIRPIISEETGIDFTEVAA